MIDIKIVGNNGSIFPISLSSFAWREANKMQDWRKQPFLVKISYVTRQPTRGEPFNKLTIYCGVPRSWWTHWIEYWQEDENSKNVTKEEEITLTPSPFENVSQLQCNSTDSIRTVVVNEYTGGNWRNVSGKPVTVSESFHLDVCTIRLNSVDNLLHERCWWSVQMPCGNEPRQKVFRTEAGHVQKVTISFVTLMHLLLIAFWYFHLFLTPWCFYCCRVGSLWIYSKWI